MNTTQSDGPLSTRAVRAARLAAEGPASGRVPTNRELALLESAHDRLLRQVQDLRRVYAAERERRGRLARATMDLATVLARDGVSSAFGPPGPADSDATGPT